MNILTSPTYLFFQIRGNGLAYSYYFSHSVDSGELRFYISRANNVLEAYTKTKVSAQRFVFYKTLEKRIHTGQFDSYGNKAGYTATPVACG